VNDDGARPGSLGEALGLDADETIEHLKWVILAVTGQHVDPAEVAGRYVGDLAPAVEAYERVAEWTGEVARLLRERAG
jgi:hypothetical protein